MENKEQPIITIATFYDPFEAQVMKTKIESEGIPCYLADGNLLPSYAFFSNEGGVKLKIRAEDQSRVKKILQGSKG
jgi:hypothetical protein